MKAFTSSTNSIWMTDTNKAIVDIFAVYHGTNVIRRRLSETCAVEKHNTRRILGIKASIHIASFLGRDRAVFMGWCTCFCEFSL